MPTMTNLPPRISDADELQSVCRLSFLKIELVDEFVTFEPEKTPRPVGDVKLFPNTPEKEPSHSVILRSKSIQNHTGRPLSYNGKIIDLSGAEVSIFGSDEKYPESEVDIPANVSFHKTDIAIQITRRTFAGLVERIRENKFHELEILSTISLHEEDQRQYLKLSVKKVWLRAAFPITQRKGVIWSIVGGLIIAMLIARII